MDLGGFEQFCFVCDCVKGVKGSIGSFINLIMELKKCCNHAFLVRRPDASDETVDVDRFEVRQITRSHTRVVKSMMIFDWCNVIS